jgi:hypothetical protein
MCLLGGSARFNTPGGVEPKNGEVGFHIWGVENTKTKRGSGFGVSKWKNVVLMPRTGALDSNWRQRAAVEKTRFQIQGVENAFTKRGSISRVLNWLKTNPAEPLSKRPR